MRQQKYIEREVALLFDEDWTVVKFDEHRYYKSVSGHGIRGVDFMAVHKDWGVVLIEMKNYPKGKESIPDDLNDVMNVKKEGSVRLISIINAYYNRQWYFRLVTWLGWHRLYAKEWKTWIHAHRHVQRGNYFFLGIVDYE